MSLVAEIRASNQQELQECGDRIREIHGVTSLSTSTYTELEIDILHTLQVEQLKVDALDLALLDIIRGDGRATFAKMADAVGVSTGTARTRMLRMLETGIVRIGTMWRPEAQPRQVRVGIGIGIQGSSRPLMNRIAQTPGLTFLASAIGRPDLLATVHAATFEEVITARSETCGLHGVHTVETWVHLKVLKEQH